MIIKKPGFCSAKPRPSQKLPATTHAREKNSEKKTLFQLESEFTHKIPQKNEERERRGPGAARTFVGNEAPEVQGEPLAFSLIFSSSLFPSSSSSLFSSYSYSSFLFFLSSYPLFFLFFFSLPTLNLFLFFSICFFFYFICLKLSRCFLFIFFFLGCFGSRIPP